MARSGIQMGVGLRADGMIAVGISGIGAFAIDPAGARGVASDLLWACELAENPALSPNLDALPGLPPSRLPEKEGLPCHGKAQRRKPGKPPDRKPGKP